MKTILLALAALAPGMAFGQTAYTTPVGYVQHTIKEGYNLLGLTVQLPSVATGVFSAKNGNNLTASGITFDGSPTPLLTPGKTYILELPDGTVQEGFTWSGSVLTTPDDISAQITVANPPSVIGTAFKIRPAATVADVFGAQNSAGLKSTADLDLTQCDTIIAVTAAGLVTIYFYNDNALPTPTMGWYTDSNEPAENIVLSYSDGFYVNRAAGNADLNFTVSGEVKTKPSGSVISPGYNYMGAVTPVGLTLATSGLSNYISHTADLDLDATDTIYLATDGGYVRCYFYDDGALPTPTTGWYTDSNEPADNLPLTSGFLIYSVSGSDKPLTISVPSSYSSL